MRRFLLLAAAAMLTGATLAVAQDSAPTDLASAKRQADEAKGRSDRLEVEAAKARGQAERARAQAAALAAGIESAEADITAAETRVRLIEQMRAEQRARLAVEQAPLVRLTAALQTMARRPAALALVQPGSLDEVVHVRALLASTLPAIRAKTAGLRSEVARGNALRRQAEVAVAALRSSQGDLRHRRIALARFETRQRALSQNLAQSALTESDRALAFGEEARELAELEGTKVFQAQLRARLATLAEPLLRPVTPPAADPSRPRYILPVQGRVLTGTGEISDAGVHARGVTLETASGAEVVSPAPGRILYARRFRSYGNVVIIDHGQGWVTALTNLGALTVKAGDPVARGAAVGRAGGRVSIELRKDGRPVPITALIG